MPRFSLVIRSSLTAGAPVERLGLAGSAALRHLGRCRDAVVDHRHLGGWGTPGKNSHVPSVGSITEAGLKRSSSAEEHAVLALDGVVALILQLLPLILLQMV